ncbi:MAG: hypothetical protein QOH68_1782 [Nocardioidaceae bacterium]|nr:hypothetical protein [Nocardioidaceae bacterium]
MPAGWYPDDGGQLRWWDGTHWTEHVQPAATPSPLASNSRESRYAAPRTPIADEPAATVLQPSPESSPTSASSSVIDTGARGAWYSKRWVIGVVALIIGLAIGSSGSSGSSDPKESDQYQSLSTSYHSTRDDVSDLRTDLADERAKQEELKKELIEAKDAEAAAMKKAKSAQALLAEATPNTSKPAPVAQAAPDKHACTRTASGSCIQGGEFCRQALYGQAGWNASGTRYTCTGDKTHPHWE